MSEAGEKSSFSVGPHSQWVRALGSFALGGVLIAIYLWLVGWVGIQRALSHVSPRRVLSLMVVGVVPVVVWGSALHLVFVRLGIGKRLITSVLLFTAASFLNSVTPFGQVGGDPLSAVLFKRSLRTDFETGLAAIGSVNALNRVASLFLGLIGVGYFGTQVTFGESLNIATMGAVALTVIVLIGGAIAWEYRQTLVRRSATLLARVLEPTGGLPGVEPPSRDSLLQRGYRFTEAIWRLVDSPGTLGLVFIAGIAGQLAVASTLWVALAALGIGAPFAVVLFLIPVAKLGGAAPTPGGFGSTEAVLTALMMAIIGIDGAIAGAAAVLYRASAFWLPSLFGGMATAWYVIHKADRRGDEADSSHRIAASPTDLATEIDGETNVRVSILLVTVSVSLVVLLAVVIHSHQLLIEPGSLLVHVTRDSALVLLSFGMTWLTLKRVTRYWVT